MIKYNNQCFNTNRMHYYNNYKLDLFNSRFVFAGPEGDYRSSERLQNKPKSQKESFDLNNPNTKENREAEEKFKTDYSEKMKDNTFVISYDKDNVKYKYTLTANSDGTVRLTKLNVSEKEEKGDDAPGPVSATVTYAKLYANKVPGMPGITSVLDNGVVEDPQGGSSSDAGGKRRVQLTLSAAFDSALAGDKTMSGGEGQATVSVPLTGPLYSTSFIQGGAYHNVRIENSVTDVDRIRAMAGTGVDAQASVGPVVLRAGVAGGVAVNNTSEQVLTVTPNGDLPAANKTTKVTGVGIARAGVKIPIAGSVGIDLGVQGEAHTDGTKRVLGTGGLSIDL